MLYELFQSVLSEKEFNELLPITFIERDLILERWRIFDACDRGLSPFWFGSITEDTVNHIHIPAVLAVPIGWREGE